MDMELMTRSRTVGDQGSFNNAFSQSKSPQKFLDGVMLVRRSALGLLDGTYVRRAPAPLHVRGKGQIIIFHGHKDGYSCSDMRGCEKVNVRLASN